MNDIEKNMAKELFDDISDKTIDDVFQFLIECYDEDILKIIKEGLKDTNPNVTNWSF
tara:strand:- start:5670 stop:5840 length:171 start_codon:yes stop_codon:yes gene_type:complete